MIFMKVFRSAERMNVVSYPIRDIVLEAKEEEKKGKKMIYLNIGDPPLFNFSPFPPLVRAVEEALKKNYKGYAPSNGDKELREIIAKEENCSEEDVFITNGLTEGIDFIFNSALGFGEKVLLPNPVYPLYLTKARQYANNYLFYYHTSEGEIDILSLEKNIKGAKMLVIINPNNPLGSLYSEKNLKEVVKLCAEYNVFIFYDASYDRIVFENEVNFHKIAKGKVPYVYGRSLSKNYSYPGARIGWVTFHGEELNEIKQSFFLLCNQRLSVNWEFQKGAIAALTDPSYEEYLKNYKKELIRRRDSFIKVTKNLPLTYPMPKGAFYVFIKLLNKKWKSDWDFVRAAIKEGVVFVPGSGFGTAPEELYFRTTILPPAEIIEEAFKKIEKLL